MLVDGNRSCPTHLEPDQTNAKDRHRCPGLVWTSGAQERERTTWSVKAWKGQGWWGASRAPGSVRLKNLVSEVPNWSADKAIRSWKAVKYFFRMECSWAQALWRVCLCG